MKGVHDVEFGGVKHAPVFEASGLRARLAVENALRSCLQPNFQTLQCVLRRRDSKAGEILRPAGTSNGWRRGITVGGAAEDRIIAFPVREDEALAGAVESLLQVKSEIAVLLNHFGKMVRGKEIGVQEIQGLAVTVSDAVIRRNHENIEGGIRQRLLDVGFFGDLSQRESRIAG